jgi:endonuclease-3
MATQLVAEHGGDVPADMEKLTKLPGVGRKTANVVLGHALGVPGLPVDRHVLRVSNRIGIASGDDPVKVEAQLCAALPPQMWTLASDVQILHGRRICRPKPRCERCSVRKDCDYYRNVISAGGRPAAAKRKNVARRVRTPRR